LRFTSITPSQSASVCSRTGDRLGHRDSRVVDEDGDRAERRGGLVDGRGNAHRIGDVERHDHRMPALLRDAPRELLALREAAARERHAGAGGRERHREMPAEVAERPCNERGFAGHGKSERAHAWSSIKWCSPHCGARGSGAERGPRTAPLSIAVCAPQGAWFHVL